MNKKLAKISALLSLMLAFSFTACNIEVSPQYTVTFNANDGSESPASATQVFTEGKAQALTTIESLGFSKSGYSFAGWATSSDASSAAYTDGASYTATADVTLYAVWSINTYTVTFNANDGSSSPATATQTFTAGTAQILTTVESLGFSKSGYSFAGWATSSDASSAAYTDGASYTATADVTLFAVWSINTYTVTFNANDGSSSPATATQTFTAGTAQILTTVESLGFSKSGYNFTGWATSSDASSAAYTDGASYTATENVTLYAVWSINTYTVTFNANDGSSSPATATQTFTAGSAQVLKTAATLGFSRSGYNFAGWARSKTAISAAYTDGASYTATADVTLYAVWTLARYTVTFNANYDGARPATATQTFTAGSAQALKTAATLGFSRSGYNFAGWARSNTSISAAYTDGASYTATADVTLYAVWTLARYTVTFNANYDGASPATGSQSFTAGSAQTLKTAATLGFSRSGYNFTGWARSNTATSAVYTDGASYTATENVTLYAVWTLAQYTVTFNANDGSQSPATGSQTFTAGTAQALKTAATLGFSRSGYSFAGWATSSDASSAAYADGASYTATADVTLYAVWTVITYTVTFNANDGSQSPATGSQSFTAGSVQALKTIVTLGFSRSGYSFAGWATSSDASSAAYTDGASYTATENVTLYAVWAALPLSSISVSGTPSKTVYLSGESFDSTGITVTATYSDGSTGTVTTYTNDLGTSICYNGKVITLSYTYNSVTKTVSLTGPFYIAASDALTQTVQDNGSTTIDSNTFQLVKFGDFPQTIADDDITYSESTVYNGWYLGSDGYFYEKVQENGCSTSYKYSNGTSVAEINNNTPNYLYFKVEPVEWRVLKTDNYHRTKLLLSEKILTANVLYYGSDEDRTLNDTTIYPNNYKYSNIRAYLNGTKNQYVTDGGTSNTYTVDWSDKGFLQKAFTTSAQALIATTKVYNFAVTTTDSSLTLMQTTYPCDNTSDKIFLLSEMDVTISDYGFASYNSSGAGNSRIRETTDYAKANCASQSTTSGLGGRWWLRSPYCNYPWYARYVGVNGSANNPYPVCDDSSIGVCPALSISF